jgi:hypothetical protein
MKKKKDPLDDQIRDKLNQLHVEYNPQRWEQFEELLDKREAGTPVTTDRSLDEIVFEKMHTFLAGSRAAHWGKLAARLNEQVDVYQKLLAYKLMEASLVLLLLLMVGQNFPVRSAKNTPKSKQPVALQEPNATIDNNFVHKNTANDPLASKNQPVTSPTLQPTIDITQVRPVANASNSASTKTKTTPPVAKKYFPKHPDGSPHLTQLSLEASNIPIKAPALDENLINGNTSDLTSTTPQQLESFYTLKRGILTELQYQSQSAHAPNIVRTLLPRRSGWVVGMFGNGDYNQVLTPPAVIAEEYREGIRRYAPGYGGGITVGLELGRWEIGGGAVYSAKKYQPRPVLHIGGNFVDGYDGEGLRSVELNMVQLPVYFRYNFIYHNKWRAYATLGLALHVNFQTNYYYADAASFKNIYRFAQSNVNYTPEVTTDLPGGWLDGGSLWQNGYISGNIGIGLERYITGRWSLFAQPTYHQSLNYFTQGIGPDKDRINTMSIFTGVRVRLNP